MNAVVGYGVVGKAIERYVAENPISGLWDFMHPNAIPTNGDTHISHVVFDLTEEAHKLLEYERVILACSVPPPLRFLREYTGDLALVSTKGVFADDDYGRFKRNVERDMLYAENAKRVTIWRFGYVFGEGERDNRLVERIVRGTFVPQQQELEPITADECARVIVENVRVPKMTADEVACALREHAGRLA